MSGFVEKVLAAMEAKESCVCLGLDPRWELLPESFLKCLQEDEAQPEQVMAAAISDWCRQVLELVGSSVVAVKLQSAFFELLGAPGFAAFEETCRYARALDLLVIADVKRGDIGSTAQAYAQAYLARRMGAAPLAHACTVSPYLGEDGILPFVQEAAREQGGVFVLVKTSNPSSGQLQDLECGGVPVHVHTARMVQRMNRERLGGSGYGPVGAVVGATWPDLLSLLRKELEHSLLLLPGFGAQGAAGEDVREAFDARGSGCLVTASRSLTFPWRKAGACPKNWQDQVQAAVQDMRKDLERVRSQ